MRREQHEEQSHSTASDDGTVPRNLTDDEFDPVTRRQVLAASGAVAATMGLAGCSGGSGGDGGSDGGDGSSDGGGDGGDGSSGGGDGSSNDGSGGGGGDSGDGGSVAVDGLVALDVDGEVTENTVPEIEVVDHQPYETSGHDSLEDGAFSLVVTVENTGDADIGPLDVTYSLALLDESGSDISDGSGTRALDYSLPAGETASVECWGGSEAYAADVARYELSVTCDGSFAEGPYCE